MIREDMKQMKELVYLTKFKQIETFNEYKQLRKIAYAWNYVQAVHVIIDNGYTDLGIDLTQ